MNKHTPVPINTSAQILFYISSFCRLKKAVAQTVKNLPAMQETQVQFLGQEDPLEKEQLPLQYSGPENSIVHGLHSPWGCKESDTTERLLLSLEHGKVGNKAQSHHQLAVWPWRNYLSSLDLKSLSYGLGNQLSHCIMKTNVWRRFLRVLQTARRTINPKGNQP